MSDDAPERITARHFMKGIIDAEYVRKDLHDAEIARLREALRLIELIGYREGVTDKWRAAHMCGAATSALEGDDLSDLWRFFPSHRAALNPDEETTT